MTSHPTFGLFGAIPSDLAPIPERATQFSPLVPGASDLEDLTAGSLQGIVMSAPPGTRERRYALALALRALAPGARLTAFAPKTKGGGRISAELASFGCEVESESRRHLRICRTSRPAMPDPQAQALIDASVTAGGPRFVESLGLWTQPGIFSWDKVDSGTAVLLSVLPDFAGRGADLGCGLGLIAKTVLTRAHVTRLDAVDIDRRAIAAARRNIADERASFHWADVRGFSDSGDLDFVVMNPPFHDGGIEDRALGDTFVRQAHRMLRGGGSVWLVANLHLPYESTLSAVFSHVMLRAEEGGYKVFEARK